jgi:hypothetical protein
LSPAVSDQTLNTGDLNNPILQHSYGVPQLTGQIQVGNDSLLNPANATGANALPPANVPPPPSSPAGLLANSASVQQIISQDPNSIIGPKGTGTSAMVPIKQPLPYTILFTNVPAAPAPAQQVTVTQQIDPPNLDWGSFRLTGFGFDGMTFSVPADEAYYQTTIDLTKQLGFEVQFTGTIDESTGIATWVFTTIDPATGQIPLDPTIGFLPPEDSSFADGGDFSSFNPNDLGEGFVSYTIMANQADITGTVITAEAAVTFDTQPPLDTNEVSNTVDAGAGLSSSATTLPPFENSLSFPVSWSGSDPSNASGLNDYTVYVSDNGGPYTAWLQNTSLTSAPFVGQDGHTYGFYTVAADNAGNFQATPTAPQTTTVVDVTLPTTTGYSFPAPGDSYTTTHWMGTIAGSASDGVSGIQKEQVSILNVATSKYWNGTSFSSSTEVFFTATLANPGANSTTWSLSFPVGNFSGDGSFKVHAVATDVAGNVDSTGVIATFYYDNAPPVTTDSLSGVPGGSPYRSAVTVTLNASDAVSGVAATYYTIDGLGQQTYTSPFTVTGQGSHHITFWSVDAAGNIETAGSDSFTIQAVSLSLSNFVGAPSSVQAGGQYTFTFKAVDLNNNPVSGATVAFGLASGSVGGTFGAVVDNGDGTYSATFTASTLVGSDTLAAVVYGQNVSSTPPTITVTPAAASKLVVRTQPSPTATAGSPFGAQPVVAEEDQYGNVLTSDSVHTVTAARGSHGSASLQGSGLTVTLSNGVATFSGLSYNKAETMNLVFTDNLAGVTAAVSTDVVVSAAAVDHFLISIPPAVGAGTPFSFTATAQDPFNNTVAGYSGVVHFSSSDGQAVLPADSTLNNGVGAFAALFKTAGGQTITAADSVASSIAGASNPVNVSAGAATHFGVAAPASAVTGTTFNVTVTALDAFGNTAVSYTGKVHFTSTDAAAVLPANSNLTNGVGAFSVTLNTSGSQTITATDAVNSSLTGVSAPLVLRGLTVTSFTMTPTGFTVTFDKPFNPSVINLYDAASASYGAADVVLAGQLAANNPVKGSLLIDPTNTTITFVKTGGVLTPDTYTVTLVSGANAFKDANGAALDGNNSGVPGTSYTMTFTVGSSSAVVVSVPSFARGPDAGHNVNVPNTTTGGIPIKLGNGSGVTDATLTVNYDPTLLTVSGATVNSALSGATLTLSGTSTPGHGVLIFHSPTALAAGAVTLGGLVAQVPNNAPYRNKALLDLSNIQLNGGSIAAIAQDGLEAVAYFGDASGNGTFSGLDTSLISRVASKLDSGFAAYRLLDPVIVADINNNGRIDSNDAAQLAQFLVSNASVPAIPPIPSPAPSLTFGGPDPTLSLPTGLTPTADGVVVPVSLDSPHPAGSTGMTEASLALAYDPNILSVSANDVRLGTIPESGSGWTLRTQVDSSTGQIGIELYSTRPIASSAGGSLVEITFHVLPGAMPGATAVQLVGSTQVDGQTIRTAVDDDQGAYTLSPTPTNAAPVSGIVVLTSAGSASGVIGSGDSEKVASTPADETVVASMVSGSAAIEPIAIQEESGEATVFDAASPATSVQTSLSLTSSFLDATFVPTPSNSSSNPTYQMLALPSAEPAPPGGELWDRLALEPSYGLATLPEHSPSSALDSGSTARTENVGAADASKGYAATRDAVFALAPASGVRSSAEVSALDDLFAQGADGGETFAD